MQLVSGFFAVTPKEDCPHLDIIISEISVTEDIFFRPCATCAEHNIEENWQCLICGQNFCSRFMKGHMVLHNETTGHHLAFSLNDGSFWCYLCDSYIYNADMMELGNRISRMKAGTPRNVFDRDTLVAGLKTKRFKRVIFLTGAGISVAAGIPDFRSPGSGIYSQLQDLGLPSPEAVFDLAFFKDNPVPFFQIAKHFFTNVPTGPTHAHRFIKRCADENQLLLNFTQNVDGLELETGLDPDLLVQAHGHLRSAHCCEAACNKEYPISSFFEYARRGDVMYCAEESEKDITREMRSYSSSSSSGRCAGVVKPDVIFFGETLPSRFRECFFVAGSADLVIVMGTSLKVFPFAGLLNAVSPETPVVLVNRDNPGIDREGPFLFLPGEIEETVTCLMDDVGWSM